MGVKEVLDGYTYLKNIIHLWKRYWIKRMAKMNEMVGMNNRLVMSRGKKRLRVVCPFKRQELCKLIGFIILADTYGMKVHKL